MGNSEVYKFPEYYSIGYGWNTEAECNFIESCLKEDGPTGASRLLDIGCGSGRHLIELAKRGYRMTGCDLSPEMISFAKEEANKAGADVMAVVEDMCNLTIKGTFDCVYCLMDTFRFLLTNEGILAHLRTMAGLLVPGGLYITDFWIPSRWDQIGSEIHKWEQSEGDRTVRVFYLQHPESINAIDQTFEDELIFEVHEAGATKEIRGGRTRTRLVMPQEFRALVELSGAFKIIGCFSQFDRSKSWDQAAQSWRMITVLRRK